MCLVCGAQVDAFREYSLNRHYVTKHAEKYSNYSDEKRVKESDAFLAKLQNQQGLEKRTKRHLKHLLLFV